MGTATTQLRPPATEMRLVSVQVGRPQWHGTPGGDPADKPWHSGFFKSPVAGPVAVRRHQLDGDGQADLRHHGGPDKAVLAYSADHYPAWRDELEQADFAPGAFGENLTLAGLTEASVCLGDVYRVGTATLALSQPRQPCWKLARRWNIKDLPARVVMSGRSGWYLRVVEEGAVEAGDPAELLERPEPNWSVARANEIYYHRKRDAGAIRALIAVGPLAECWKIELRKRLEEPRGGGET